MFGSILLRGMCTEIYNQSHQLPNNGAFCLSALTSQKDNPSFEMSIFVYRKDDTGRVEERA